MYLNTHSAYSLRYGVVQPQAILQWAAKCGIQRMALTDINAGSAAMDWVRMAPDYGIHPVVGIDFRNGADQCYVALARNHIGYYEICQHLSRYLHSKQPIPAEAPKLQGAYIIYPWGKEPQRRLRDHEYLGIRPQQLNRLQLLQKPDIPRSKWVALASCTFRGKRDHNAHRLLRAVANNVLLSKLDKREEGLLSDHYHTPEQLAEVYKQMPDLLLRSEELLESCEVDFGFRDEQMQAKNLRSYTGTIEEDIRLIRSLCDQGLSYRYPEPSPVVHYRIEKELEIIEKKGFLSYFLINWDITRYARQQGYFYVGRGSGANSIVAYILRITDVDPIELDLYFERFINLYRQNPPDFDIDFSWTDRDDVTRYIFDRFPDASLLATYNTFQYRAVVRELGKVFGLPKREIDKLSTGDFSMQQLDSLSQLVLKYSSHIQGLPSYLSIHAGGILIPEIDIHHYTPTFLPPKGYPTTQFDMVVAEDIGLDKFDILSQRGLGKIKDALHIIRDNQPQTQLADIHNLSSLKEDEKIKSILRQGKALGCFYVESPAMRMLLSKLRVDSYLGLVAASSIIRPGVSNSGMMREYIIRYRDPARRQDAHPTMLEIMPDTYGVMVYQEDVIKVAHYFAGLTLGEADVLRRGMSGKFRSRSEFQKVKQKFFDNCKEIGHTDQLTAEIWRQIESFAGYAFAKGHSASYAVESYQSLYLKAHFPLEYMVATINNFGGFYRTEIYVHEARIHGADIQNPCINHSDFVTTLHGKRLYLGFMHVRELEAAGAQQIEQERALNGPYLSLDNFLDRLPLSLDQASILIRTDAFRCTGKHRRTLLWELHMKYGKVKKPQVAPLFGYTRRQWNVPSLYQDQLEDVYDELELIGFPVTQSPFALLQEDPPSHVLRQDWPSYTGQEITAVGYLVAVKNTKTKRGDRMKFANFLDRQGHFIDTVHFPPVAAAYPFRGKGIYLIRGRVTEEFGFHSLEASYLEKLAYTPDPRYAEMKTMKIPKIEKVHR